VDEIHDGRLRKVYSITDAGKAELQSWLTDPDLEPVAYRDLALLKIGLLRPGAHPGASSWIAAELERNTKMLEEAERWLQENSGRVPKYSRLVAEYGREVQRVRVRWLERVLGETQRDARAERG
jgi:DNA-binding PadR family transcriptional regulator